MRCFVFSLLLWVVGLFAVSAEELPKGPVKVFILAGQSNMQGYGATKTLPWLGEDPKYGDLLKKVRAEDGSWKTREDVLVYYPRRDLEKKGGERIGKLTVGYGARDQHVGPELFFGQVLGDYYEEPVLLVKVCWGGRSLAVDFRPPSAGGETGKNWKDMLTIAKEVRGNLGKHFPDLAGRDTELCGLVWFQGWNDHLNADRVKEYESNLVHFIKDARKELGALNMPVVVGELGVGGPTTEKTKPHVKAFREAQVAACTKPEFAGNVAFFKTSECWDFEAAELVAKGWKGRAGWKDKEMQAKFDKMGCQPPYHYLGSGKIMALIGNGFGEEMVRLLENKKQEAK